MVLRGGFAAAAKWFRQAPQHLLRAVQVCDTDSYFVAGGGFGLVSNLQEHSPFHERFLGLFYLSLRVAIIKAPPVHRAGGALSCSECSVTIGY